MNLVYYLIRTYYPNFIKDEDVVQSAMLGLCSAAEKFDKTKGEFSTYASQWILGEIKKVLRDRDRWSVETSLEQILEGNKDEYSN